MKISQWFTNPFNHPFSQLVLLTLVLLFAGAGLALLVQTMWQKLMTSTGTFSLGQIKYSSNKILWQRYRTWVVIAVFFGGAALSGPLPLAGLCAFICWQGGREYAHLTGLLVSQFGIMVGSGWLTLLGVLIWGQPALLYAPLVAFFVYSALALQPSEAESDFTQRFEAALRGLWGYMYIGWLPAHLLGLSVANQTGLVLVIGLGVAMSDIGAYCSGKLLGGPKLAPRLSPNKTWGGVLGNLAGAQLATALLVFTLPLSNPWQLLALACVIGLGSIWGDLLESLLKRQCGVKDAGQWLSGFGGLLDRVDSLLLVAPLVYYLGHFFR